MAIIIHVGMPKTGTTTFQGIMDAARNKLSDSGWYYPLGLTFEKLGHHGLATAVQENDSAYISEFMVGLKQNHKRDTLISSENFINPITSRSFPLFLAFLQQLQSIDDIKILITFRRIDEFLESMYLHEIKYNQVNISFNQYVEARKQWIFSLFERISVLSKEKSLSDVIMLSYDKNCDIVSDIIKHLSIKTTALKNIQPQRVNVKYGWKAQTLFKHYERVSKILGLSLGKQYFVEKYQTELSQIPDDSEKYTIFPQYLDELMLEKSLRAAYENNNSVYLDAFLSAKIETVERHQLEFSEIENDDTLDYIQNMLKKEKS